MIDHSPNIDTSQQIETLDILFFFFFLLARFALRRCTSHGNSYSQAPEFPGGVRA